MPPASPPGCPLPPPPPAPPPSPPLLLPELPPPEEVVRLFLGGGHWREADAGARLGCAGCRRLGCSSPATMKRTWWHEGLHATREHLIGYAAGDSGKRVQQHVRQGRTSGVMYCCLWKSIPGLDKRTTMSPLVAHGLRTRGSRSCCSCCGGRCARFGAAAEACAGGVCHAGICSPHAARSSPPRQPSPSLRRPSACSATTR